MKSDFSKASFVEVRTPEEYGSGHYPGAVNIPLNEVLSRIDEFKDMQKPVVLYCRSGNRSGMAAALLKQHGITEVYNGGGLDDLPKK